MPSSVIRFFHYDAGARELLIGFQTGKRYVYQEVPEEVFNGLRSAASRGEYFNDHMRDRFNFVRRAEEKS